MTNSLPVGTEVWAPDQSTIWAEGVVVSEAPEGLVVRVGKDEKKYKSDELCLKNVGVNLKDMDDLTKLMHLHEAAVLRSIDARFGVDRIYTLTGRVLIAVNPFKNIDGLYDLSMVKNHLEVESSMLPPHVYMSALVAYRGVIQNNKKQTVLISGESGAGKTESTKFVMRVIALAGSDDWENRSMIEGQVLATNPLLESFGNARTLRNDNSSRFGKFIEMQLLDGRLVGARIFSYLLEAIRVCHQTEGERTFHFFYQLCAADESAHPVLPTLGCLGKVKEFVILNNSSIIKVPSIDDKKEFMDTLQAMRTIGLAEDEITSTLKVVASILHLGNIKFQAPKGQSEISEVIESDSVTKCCELLGVSKDSLSKTLCHRVIKATNQTINKPIRVSEAEDAKGGLIRAVYSSLFNWIIEKCNTSIGYREDVKLSCGVLDIFGFECFENNSFEQLCINFTNERLQELFNNYVFQLEEQLYIAEGISWDALDFPDNADCVALINGTPWGLFAMLDEECMLPAGGDKGYASKIKEKHKDNQRFVNVKTNPLSFTLLHFAGPVFYDTQGFVEKNRDALRPEVQDCLSSSNDPFISSLLKFLQRQDATPKSTAKMTVSSTFRQQLSHLIETINLTEPHFIRCIKPNPKNKPILFDNNLVVEQLRYGGVLQAVKVSRAGYAVRLLHEEFRKTFRFLVKDKSMDAKGLLNAIKKMEGFSDLGLGDLSCNVGKTLVFMKHPVFRFISHKLDELKRVNAVKIQSIARMVVQRRLFIKQQQAALTISRCVRGLLARKLTQRVRTCKAATNIQKYYRRRVAMHYLHDARQISILIKHGFYRRVYRELQMEKRKNGAILYIQAIYRMLVVRNRFRNQRAAVIMIQKNRRRQLGRRELREERAKAKDVDKLKDQIEALKEETRVMKQRIKEAEVLKSKLVRQHLFSTSVHLVQEIVKLWEYTWMSGENASPICRSDSPGAPSPSSTRAGSPDLSQTIFYEKQDSMISADVKTDHIELWTFLVEKSKDSRRPAIVLCRNNMELDYYTKKVKETNMGEVVTIIGSTLENAKDMEPASRVSAPAASASSVIQRFTKKTIDKTFDYLRPKHAANYRTERYPEWDRYKPVQHVQGAVTPESQRHPIITAMAFGKFCDKPILGVGTKTGEFSVFAPEDGIWKLRWTRSLLEKAITHIVFSADDRVAVSSVDRSVLIFCVSTNEALVSLVDLSTVMGVVFCAPGSNGVMLVSKKKIRILEYMSGEKIDKVSINREVVAASSMTDNSIAVASVDGKIFFLLTGVNPTNPFEYSTYETQINRGEPRGLTGCLTDKGVYVALVVWSTSTMSIVLLINNRLTERTTLKFDTPLHRPRLPCLLLKDGYALFSDDKKIAVRDTSNDPNPTTHALTAHEGTVSCMASLGTNDLLVTGDESGEIVFWQRTQNV